MKEVRNIGIDVKNPKEACEGDKHCPFHGEVCVRGKTWTGTVVSAKVQKNAIVSWERQRIIPKYERFEKRRTKIMVHNPTCINAKKGDKVKIMETRKISKNKNYVIIEKIMEK